MGLLNLLNGKPKYITKTGNIASREFKILAELVFMEQASNGMKVFLITSTTYGEGKTITAVNLAIMMARLGKKTLLIDANLRHPMISKVFGIEPAPGLDILTNGDADLEDLKRHIDFYSIDVITHGGGTAEPLPILSSPGFKGCLKKARDLFDIVIMDSPAVIASVDPLLLSSMTDGVVFVAMPERIRKEEMLAAKMEIESANGKIVGVVVNNMNDPIPSIVKKMF